MLSLLPFLGLMVSLSATSTTEQQAQTNLQAIQQRDNFPPPRETNQHTHDPSILFVDSTYYLYHIGPNINISTAPSMDGPWTYAGPVLSGPSVIPKPQDNLTWPWAPSAIERDGKFYCYYCRHWRRDIFFAGSRGWYDHGAVIETETGEGSDIPPFTISNAIDPDPFITDDGVAYLNYGSYWTGIYQVPLRDDMLAPKSSIDLDTRHLIGPGDGGTSQLEGSFLSYNNGFYYLWFSQGACCDYDPNNLPAPGQEYSIRVGRSDNLRGPFFDKSGKDLVSGGGELVYGSNGNAYAPGGQGVVFDGENDILYYHYCKFDIHLSERVLLDSHHDMLI
ncbi:uncharacterized protein N7483_003831 [Penicillium malachiteum]|uniref:uncharacterized protein n=1 Tax=Penicillium malachiteum TaxID=1324776 RepID=UPI0025485297|nr:uncharacterized protein N7483_003831 [Penicillium malachiteum]KAJ5729323.1 hypothetical protein N7483_003831 [Penicillium malachiteum]